MPYPTTADYGGSANSQYLYLPAGWDTAWKTAKQNVGSQRVNAIAIGDSITQGFNASDIMSTSWYALVRASILAANGNVLGGDFYSTIYSAAGNSYSSGPGTATYPMVVHGALTTDYTFFPSAWNYALYNETAQTPLIACTPPYNVVGFDILYTDYSAGTWTYNVDGGSNTTITCTGPGTSAGSSIKKISITGLTSGSHTLNINSSSSPVTCGILGVAAYVATTGLCFANLAWSGFGLAGGSPSANYLLDYTNSPIDRLATYQGYQGTTAAPTSLTGLGFPAQPDLAIIALGINDAYQSVTRGTFRDALERLVWSLRYGKNDACSIAIVAMYGPDGNSASSSLVTNMDFTGSSEYNFRDIRAAMFEVAQNEQCAFIDVHGMFGRTPVTNGWITSNNNIHPTNAGHQKIANLINSIL